MASSLFGFFIDYSCYSLIVTVMPGGAAAVPAANVTARVFSAGSNFLVNRSLVFGSDAPIAASGAAYAALALCSILAGNTALLTCLTGALGWNKYYAKLLTELTFFSLSWLAQKHVIFRAGQGG